MAVTNTNAIRFSNTRARVLADKLAQTYNLAQAIIQEGTAQGVINVGTPASAVIPNDATVISDGADVDGRPPITGADIYNLVAIAQSVLTTLQANSNAKLMQVLKVAVNPLNT